eukprot:CAMPEP_0180100986 /NCGR_PEP_ID=MMETSP0985-20121206/29242_1 /TAXON_ID=483367 /ORGANISM="non described non described, Strain CCMP 2436" /LENGTH=663 /DNA_ID=CAMNT_0022036861 /DNA_START=12 /DNA_END=2003 /DNA_ORIENTATION=-
MSMGGTGLKFELERCIDDFVFICFFVGNDFLPHMPALEIHDGAIDTLMDIYRNGMGELGGYVTDRGEVDMHRAELLLCKVGAFEEDVFQRRRRKDEGRKRMIAERERNVATEIRDAASVAAGGSSPFGSLYPPRTPDALKIWKQLEAFADSRAYHETFKIEPNGGQLRACAHLYCHLLGLKSESGFSQIELLVTNPLPADADAAAADATHAEAVQVKAIAESGEAAAAVNATPGRALSRDEQQALAAEQAESAARASRFKVELKLNLDKRDSELQAMPDDVRYGSPGWRDRYYAHKLHIGADEPARLRDIVQSYVEGLIWVLRYYYKGVQSWGWFYPYHYAPCASDMSHLCDLLPQIAFEKGEPWSPLTQLMAVFPARSGHAMPVSYRELMANDGSSVIDFYPSDFKQDLNGKKFGWQAIAVLPFIDAVRLQSALAPLKPQLADEERRRDTHGPARIFTRCETTLGQELKPLAESLDLSDKVFTCSQAVAFGGTAKRPAAVIEEGKVVCCTLEHPPPAGHISRLLPTVQLPYRTLLEGESPVFSRDAKNLVRDRERGGGGGGHYGGGGGGGQRRGIGHVERGPPPPSAGVRAASATSCGWSRTRSAAATEVGADPAALAVRAAQAVGRALGSSTRSPRSTQTEAQSAPFVLPQLSKMTLKLAQ